MPYLKEREIRKDISMERYLKLFVCAGCALLLTGCSGKEKINLEELVTLDFAGSDGGYGYASCDFEPLEDWLSENCSEEAALSLAIAIEDGVDITLSPEEGLSNGDEVKVTILYDDGILDGYDFQLAPDSGDSWTVTVDGLEEAEKVDLFDGISLEYESDGSYAVTGGYDNITYTLSKNRGLKNGDTVTITASYEGDGASLEEFCIQSYGMIPESDTCEYTVDGLEEYPSSPEEIPASGFDQLKQEAVACIQDMKWQMEDSLGADGYSVNDYTYDRCVIATPAERTAANKNEVYLIYKINATNPDGTFDYYYPVMFSNVIIDLNGNFTYDPDPWLPDGSYSYWSGVSGENYFSTGSEGSGFVGFETLQDFEEYYMTPYEGEWNFSPDNLND